MNTESEMLETWRDRLVRRRQILRSVRSAAPDLYVALKDLLADHMCLTAQGDGSLTPEQEKARAAIAKAEGKG